MKRMRSEQKWQKTDNTTTDRRYGSPTKARQYIEKPFSMLFKGKEKSYTVVKLMQELGSFEPFKHLKGYRKEIELNTRILTIKNGET